MGARVVQLSATYVLPLRLQEPLFEVLAEAASLWQEEIRIPVEIMILKIILFICILLFK
jgi:hypothetical protein